jgi:hypothetical protein
LLKCEHLHNYKQWNSPPEMTQAKMDAHFKSEMLTVTHIAYDPSHNTTATKICSELSHLDELDVVHEQEVGVAFSEKADLYRVHMYDQTTTGAHYTAQKVVPAI